MRFMFYVGWVDSMFLLDILVTRVPSIRIGVVTSWILLIIYSKVILLGRFEGIRGQCWFSFCVFLHVLKTLEAVCVVGGSKG